MNEPWEEGLFSGTEVSVLESVFYKLMAQGEPEAAGAVAKAMFEITMFSEQPWRLSGIYMGEAMAEQKDEKNDGAPKRGGGAPVSEEGLSYLYQKVGDDFLGLDAAAEAIPYLERAVRLNPDFALAHYDLSLAYFMLGRYREGAEAAKAALRDDPEMKYQRSNLGQGAMGNLGLCLMNQGKLEEAVACFTKIIAQAGSTFFNLGLALLRMDKPKDALKNFLTAVEISPKEPEYFNVLGQAYGEIGKVEKAESCLHKAIEIDPKYALGYYDLGVILAKQRTRDKEAKKCFKKAVELDPDMGWAHYSIACIDALEGKKREALKNLERAFEKGIEDRAHIDKDADLDSLRKDGKFQEMMKKYFGSGDQRRA